MKAVAAIRGTALGKASHIGRVSLETAEQIILAKLSSAMACGKHVVIHKGAGCLPPTAIKPPTSPISAVLNSSDNNVGSVSAASFAVDDASFAIQGRCFSSEIMARTTYVRVKKRQADGTGRPGRMAGIRVAIADTARLAMRLIPATAAASLKVSNLSTDAIMALLSGTVAAPLGHAGVLTQVGTAAVSGAAASLTKTPMLAGKMARRGRDASCAVAGRPVRLMAAGRLRL